MGEHKFKVGDRVKRCVDCADAGVCVSVGDPAVLRKRVGSGLWTVLNLAVGEEQQWSENNFQPADPPSVGVPDPADILAHDVDCNCGRCLAISQALQRQAFLDQQQMAAQQQGQRQDLGGIEGTELANDLCELLRPFVGELGQTEGARDTLGRLVNELLASRAAWAATQKPGDVLGDRDKLRREKADLETQVAYLTRELVLAKGRAKGGR